MPVQQEGQQTSFDRVVDWFDGQDAVAERLGGAIRQSLDEVLDTPRTGRVDPAQLSEVERAYVGEKVPILTRSTFGFRQGRRLDCVVAGEEVEVAWADGHTGPPGSATVPHGLCLHVGCDESLTNFSAGLARPVPVRGRVPGVDDRTGVDSPDSAVDPGTIRWFVEGAPVPPSVLAELSPRERSSVLDGSVSGQTRAVRLFRAVQNRRIRREMVGAVSSLDDVPKAVRVARRRLAADGIIILGCHVDHVRIANALGIAVPHRGTWVSTRVTPSHDTDQRSIDIDGTLWRAAQPGDPAVSGPRRY